MRRVERGESVTVTRNGTPVADLVPHSSANARRPQFVPVEAIAAGVTSLPHWGAQSFAEDLRALDEAVDDRDVDRWRG